MGRREEREGQMEDEKRSERRRKEMNEKDGKKN